MNWIKLSILSLLLSVPSPAAASESVADDTWQEFQRLCSPSLWPGFDPGGTPLMVFDGQRTWLFDHPSPPREFSPTPNETRAWQMQGLHPDLRANTSIELDGVATATIYLNPDRSLSVPALGAIAIHETFHIFQKTRHPDWIANEAELFTYPVAVESLLTLRRLETDALARALDSPSKKEMRSWAATALAYRNRRFEALPQGAREYEQRLELFEGLAYYLQLEAGPEELMLSSDGYSIEAIRERCYVSGAAWAQLLDVYSQYWKTRIENEEFDSLHEALAARIVDATPAAFTSEHIEARELQSREEVRGLQTRLEEARSEVLARPGWRLVVVNHSAGPLMPQGFDPLNVTVVGGLDVIHGRWIKVGNETGTVEILDGVSLTTGVGPHPLFNGIEQLVVTGLSEKPLPAQRSGRWSIRSDTVHLDFERVSWKEKGEELTLYIWGSEGE